MDLTIFWYTLLFFLGMIMWSFAGVVMERGRGGFEFDRLQDIFLGRSYCIWCNKTLTVWQLVPLFWWLFQWWKCFRCKSNIPVWYLLFEMMMWWVFMLVAFSLPWFSMDALLTMWVGWQPLLFWILLAWSGVAIIAADFLRYELNVWFWLFAMIWIVAWEFTWGIWSFVSGFTWLLVLVGLFGLIYWYGRRYVKRKFGEDGEGIGEWDVMIAMAIGLLMQFIPGITDWISGVQMVFIYLVVSSLLWMLFWLVRYLFARNDASVLPFLPAMIVGYVFLLSYWEQLLNFIN